MGYINASDIMDAPVSASGGREISADEMVDRQPKKPLADFLFDELLAKPAKSIGYSAITASNFLGIPFGAAYDAITGGDKGVEFLGKNVEYGLRGLEENAPSPDLGKIGKFARGAIEIIPKIAAGPLGLAEILAESATIRPAQMIEQGATTKQAELASQSGLLTGAAMTQIPLAAPTFAGTILKGGTRNVGAGIAGRTVDVGAQKLTGDDRFSAKVFDPEVMGHDFAFGAGFGLQARGALIKAGIDPATITAPMIEQKAIELASKIPSKIPYTQANIKARAAQFYNEGYVGPKGEGTVGEALPTRGPTAEATDAAQGLAGYEGALARNAAQSRELLDRVAVGADVGRETLTPTYAQETGGRLAATREQAISAQDPAMGVRMTNTDAKINEAAVKNLRNAVGPEGPPVPAPRTATETGRNIVTKIEEAKAPVRQQMRFLEDQIPDYQIRATDAHQAIKDIAKDSRISPEQDAALLKAQTLLDEWAPNGQTTTHLLVKIRRGLNNMADEASMAGKKDEAFIYNKVRDGIMSDLSRLSEMSRTGKLTVHKGAQINADTLAQEYESNLNRMAEMQKNLTPDYETIATELRAQGLPTRDWTPMDPTDARSGAFKKRIVETYKRITGKEPPTVMAEQTGKGIERYQARNKEIQAILSEVAPGQDVGAAIRAFNKYASSEWFGRFDKGSTRDVTAKGHEASGGRVPEEQVGGRFWGQSDAQDLIRAVGPDIARESIRPHMVQEILKSSTVGVEGRIDVVKAAGWIKKNQAVLDAYGLTESAKEIARGQLRDHIERKFEDLMTNPITGDPQSTINKAQKMRNELAPVLRYIGYDQKAVQGLADYYAVLKMLGRNKNVSYAGGSTTAEKLMGMYGSDKIPGVAGKVVSTLSNDIVSAMIGFGGGYSHGGAVEGTVGGIATKMGIQYAASKAEAFHQSKAKIFGQILKDAIYDPNLAHSLLVSARSNGKDPTAKAVITQAIFNAAASVMRTLKSNQNPSDTGGTQ